jgi:two-component system sensor histidine kinase SenX3
VAAALGGLIGLVTGAVAIAAFRWTERGHAGPPVSTGDSSSVLAPGVVEVLDALRLPSVVVGSDNVVIRSTATARVMGLVRNDHLFPDDLAMTASKVRRDGRPRDREIVRDPSLRDDKGLRTVEVHVAPLTRGQVLVVADDVTESRRLDTVRRDFVANVSHELKTPTGALALLAEATEHASEDPEAVRRFSHRMNHEATRLANLITELIDLTRVQDSGPLREPVEVPVDMAVAEAIDTNRTSADVRRITMRAEGEPGLVVYGDPEQLVTALRNLVANAVAYSPEGTQVVVTKEIVEDQVGISVNDEGIGIPDADLDRIFERFYRVDPARSRQTGGTGLGLSIVKHVVANHGGEIRVSSAPDEGSTFTLLLPRPPDDAAGSSPTPAAEGVTPEALTGRSAETAHRTLNPQERTTR